MERDLRLEKIFREEALLKAPDSFTDKVIQKLGTTQPATYKPLIGRIGKIIILAFAGALLSIGLIIATYETNEQLINIPEWGFHLPEMDWKIPSAVLASILAVFVLVLTDARLTKSRSI